jgi:hypothetical protein
MQGDRGCQAVSIFPKHADASCTSRERVKQGTTARAELVASPGREEGSAGASSSSQSRSGMARQRWSGRAAMGAQGNTAIATGLHIGLARRDHATTQGTEGGRAAGLVEVDDARRSSGERNASRSYGTCGIAGRGLER